MLVELSNGAQLGWSTVPGLTALLGEGVGYLHRRIICIIAKKTFCTFLDAQASLELTQSLSE